MRRSVLLRAMGALSAGVVCAGGNSSQAGPYAPAAGVAGSTAIGMNSPQISAWASGYQNYTVGPNVDLTWRNPSEALGAAEGNSFDIVSLGDGGSITLTFEQPIGDGAGFDFAVFENSFSDTFLELAFVEISADGNAFHRFDNDSLTLNPVPFIGGSIDPTNIDGLGGKYRQGFGTPFDIGALGLSQATHVRLVDVIGDGSALDTSNDVIYDPHPTVGSGGFDLDAVAVIHQTPEPASALVAIGAVGAAMLFRRSRRSGTVLAVAMLAMLGAGASANTIADIEDVAVPSGGFYNGADGAGGFTSAGITFENVYDNTWGSWNGFAASNVNDTTTPGYGNQYAAITGTGVGGAGNYAVGYDPGSFGSAPHVDLNQTVSVEGLFITNATYAYLAVADGNDGNVTPFVRQFGDDPGQSGGGNQGYADYLLLSITGHDGTDAPVGTVDFYLADYRFANNVDDYVVDAWQWVDLSSLGPVASLTFAVTSTDMSWGYINTPTYFAIDDLTIVPEPATTAWMVSAMSLLLFRTRRRRQE